MAELETEVFRTPGLVIEETGRNVPEQQTYLHIMRTAQTLGGDLSALFDRFGLSGKQYNVLRAIRRGGDTGVTASEIASQMTDRHADVTRLVDRLVREGFVTRDTDVSDRRIVRSKLTQGGEALLAEIDDPLIETHRAHLGHLSPEEMETIITLMKKARGETG